MLIFSPDELAAWTGGTWSRLPTRALSGFSIDSRRIGPGDVFVALRTDRRDGHDFVADAIARGAGAVVVTRPVDPALPALVVEDPESALRACARAHRQRFPSPVIGVTGSCGKTSTKDLLKTLLGEERTLATEANFNNTLGVPLTLLRMDPAIHDFAVIEAGINQPGEMDTLVEMITPTHGIVTMVSLAHAAGLGRVESIAREKAKLLAAVPVSGVVAFPDGCRQYPPFSQFAARALTVSQAGGAGAVQFRIQTEETHSETRLVRQRQRDTHRQDTQTKEMGAREERILEISLPGPTHFSFHVPSMTPGMLENVVLAVAVAHELGVSSELLQAGLDHWTPSRHRGEIRTVGPQVFYVDCYNANPASTIDAVRYFAERFAGQPKLYVLGSMRELGAFSRDAHISVGRELRLHGDDRAVFIGEEAEALREGAASVGHCREQLWVFPAAEDARLLVERFSGAILLKSSRAYALERLLPELPPATEMDGIAC